MANNLPTALVILDGWGWRPQTHGNAILQANTPHWDYLLQNYPHTLLSASGHDVGLPDAQMGNSEVGHLTMGAGRVKQQDLVRINESIQNGTFFENSVFLESLELAQQRQSHVHVLGLLSQGGVHSHQDHIFAFLQLTQKFKLKKVFLHAFLDGRDTPPQCAQATIEAFNKQFTKTNIELATLSGRFYAMDRDKRWERLERAFHALQGHNALFSPSALDGLAMAYQRGETDEFVQPTIVTPDYPGIEPDDSIVLLNFRADRVRQLTSALSETQFSHFERPHWECPQHITTLTQYEKSLPVHVAFEPVVLKAVLGEVLAQHNLRQLRLAETEKYAHVTYFFNGGVDEPFENETRLLIPSPKVQTYDLLPQMSAYEVCQAFTQSVEQNQHDIIICNFANADMVGHTGNFAATISAIEVLDDCLGKIVPAIKQAGGQLLITADHGNADCMYQENSNKPHTAHTTNLVPLVYVGDQNIKFRPSKGTLCDIAPTLLRIIGVEKPKEMTGSCLLE